jgi:hypothetical protein
MKMPEGRHSTGTRPRRYSHCEKLPSSFAILQLLLEPTARGAGTALLSAQATVMQRRHPHNQNLAIHRSVRKAWQWCWPSSVARRWRPPTPSPPLVQRFKAPISGSKGKLLPALSVILL